MKELIQKIEQWAEDRNIIKGSTPIDQAMKLFSEFGELADNVGKGRDIKDDCGDIFVVLTIMSAQLGETISEIIIGDIVWKYGEKSLTSELCGQLYEFVNFAKGHNWDYNSLSFALEFLNWLAVNAGSSLEECVQIAYNDIKDRKGLMHNGVFIKESDAAYGDVVKQLENNFSVEDSK